MRVGLLLLLALPAAAGAQCPTAHLPAYSHNDYERDQPLTGALALGYRGVEADVFLVDGVLRVGHDRRAAERAGTLEATYLVPLAAVAARCAGALGGAPRLLLLIEVKERSRATHDTLAALLARQPWLDADGRRPQAPVEAILVGWVPDDAVLQRQQRIAGHADTVVAGDDPHVRLLSLDHGKTMGRWFTTGASRRRWLATLRAAARHRGGRLVRVHNVPPDARAYEALLAAGVDLIGTKSPGASAALLQRRD